MHHDAPISACTRNETPMCQLYNGSVCRDDLLLMKGQYFSSANDYLMVVTDKHQDEAQFILSLIDDLPRSECTTNPQIRPFVCLYYFGLCDMDTRVSYRPCASQCKNIRDNICKDEWITLANLGFVRLPNCDYLEQMDNASLILEQEIPTGTL